MKNKRTKILLVFLLCICLAAGTYFAIGLSKDISPVIISGRYFNQLKADVFGGEGTGKPDFDNNKMVHGMAGWIQSPGTVIDYPVLQGEDNEYYLNHLPDGTENQIGSIFLDYRCKSDFSGDVSVLYGHHIKMDRMFSPLSHYKDPSYYEEHKTMTLYTPGKIYEVALFAGNILDGGSQEFPLSFKTKREKAKWVKKLIDTSTFQSDVRPSKEDKILVLCTCSYEFYNARYAVYGILTEKKVG